MFAFVDCTVISLQKYSRKKSYILKKSNPRTKRDLVTAVVMPKVRIRDGISISSPRKNPPRMTNCLEETGTFDHRNNSLVLWSPSRKGANPILFAKKLHIINYFSD